MTDTQQSDSQTTQHRQRNGALALLILLGIFLGVVLLSQTLLRGARLDLTDAKQYTLNAGTKSIVKKIPEPMNLYFFFTQKNTAELPNYQAYAQRVRELLEEMAERSNGKLKLTVVDPQPFSEEEERAVGFGLQQVPFGGGNQMIFGLAATNATGQQGTVPFFQVDKEGLLEYDVAKLIQSLISDTKPVIGVMSSLKMQGGFDMQTQQPEQPWAVYGQLMERFNMREIALDVASIDPEIKMIMLVHPKSAAQASPDGAPAQSGELSDATLYALDQFVLRGGRLMVFVDPVASMDQSGNDPNNPSSAMFADKSSDLSKLFAAWGVRYNRREVVADRELGVPIQMGAGGEPVKHPAIIGLEANNMSQVDIASADLESINLDSAGAFSVDAKNALKFEPLLQSSLDAMMLATDKLKFTQDPNQLLKDFAPSKTSYALAGNLSGKFKSAFPERAAEAGHIAEAKADNVVFLSADTDILTNRVWVSLQNFMGQQLANAFANNGDFIINTVDKLSGDNDLISIRSRGKLKTSFTLVDQLRDNADAALRTKEESLQAELAETERKLSELQATKSADNQMILSPEQKRELENFQSKRMEVRKQLREVRRGLDQQIEGLGRWVKFWGTFAAPIGVIIFALWFFRRRSKARALAAAV
jgi:ABC-type uncharacterized transport system involved in gliding motility auxiliary subunit